MMDELGEPHPPLSWRHPPSAFLRPSYFPFHVRDTDFFSRLLVVIEPFSFSKVNACELGVRLNSRS